MYNPEISIIVPVYNVEIYLKKCVDSILQQTFKSFELILVNDGSTDRSGLLCDAYEQYDNRVKVIHKENGGLSSARNAGLDIAKGKYIGFVDSDDYINHKMYEKLYKSIINYSADISICDYVEVFENKEVIYKEKTEWNENVLSNIEALDKIYKPKGWLYVVAWNKLYKRELFNELRYPLGKIHEDEMIAHEILYKANKIVVTEEQLYYYLQRENSIMGKEYNIKRLDIIDAMKKRADFFYNKKLKRLQYEAEVVYIKTFFKLYNKYSNYEIDWRNKLESLKKDYNRIIFRILKNKKYNFKEKLALYIFYISPNIYKKIINKE